MASLAFGMLVAAAACGGEEAPPAVVAGKALSTAGKPVPDVKVTLTELMPGKAPQSWAAATSADGTFRIAVPPPFRSLALRVEGPPDGKLAPCAVTPQDSLQAQPGQSVRVTILLAPATARLTGTVTDAEGKPVAGAKLTAGLARGGHWLARTAATDEKGKYEIAGLAPGAYVVRGVEPPAGTALIRLFIWRPSGVRAANLSEGQTATEDFQLARGARLAGRVLDEKGKPLPGAAVSCRLDEATEEGPRQVYQMPGQWYSGEATADAEGRFSLGGLTQETYVVEVRPPEGADLAPAALRGVNAPKEGDLKLQDITLYRAGTLIGIVVGQDGKPVADAEVSLPVGTGRFGSSVTTKTDASGNFTFGGLATSRYAVTIAPPKGSAACEKNFDDVAVVAGLSLKRTFKLPEGARVSGVVTGPDGRPVAGATVMARYGYASRGGAVADEAGKYVLAGISPPLQPQPARRDGPQNEVIAVPPKDAPCLMTSGAPLPELALGASAAVNVQMKPGAAIAGRVAGPDGKPVPGCQVAVQQKLRGAVAGYGSCRTDEAGRYEFRHLAPARMYLNVQAPEDSGLVGQLTEERTFEGGKTTTADVTLDRGGSVVGKAVTSKGRPAVGAQILLQPKTGWPLTSAKTAFVGGDGSFRVDAVVPGTYDVQCTPLDPALRAEPKMLTVAARGEAKLEVLLHVTGSVAGTMRDAEGKALGLGMAYVGLQPEAGPAGAPGGYGHPDDQGRYRIGGLVPGKYRVTVNVGPRGQAKGLAAPAPSEAIVEEGKETGLDLTVPAKAGGPARKPAEF